MDLRFGDYREVLRDVECDLVLADPPFSERVHEGHDDGAALANKAEGWMRASGKRDCPRPRRPLSYDAWTPADVFEFVQFWAPRCRGWIVVLSDSDLCATWRAAFEWHGLTGFQPLPVLMPGMGVRLCGDGPSSWAVYANVARPKALSKWGTLPGGYYGTPPNRQAADRSHIGGKPLWLMRALVRDYSRPGQLVVDPTAGFGTTLLAAAIEGRRAVGAEVDEQTFRAAQTRLAAPYTPSFAGMEVA